jgi:hypothetical protein
MIGLVMMQKYVFREFFDNGLSCANPCDIWTEKRSMLFIIWTAELELVERHEAVTPLELLFDLY